MLLPNCKIRGSIIHTKTLLTFVDIETNKFLPPQNENIIDLTLENMLPNTVSFSRSIESNHDTLK